MLDLLLVTSVVCLVFAACAGLSDLLSYWRTR